MSASGNEPVAIRLEDGGDPEPFLFVSYAHEDKEEVYRDLRQLREAGYRVWYDEGIRPTQVFAEKIANAIRKCSFFMVYVSPRAVASEWVLDEVAMALRSEKQFLAVYLRETNLPAAWDLQISRRLFAMRFGRSYEIYCQELVQTLPAHLRGETRPPSAGEDFARLIEERVESGDAWQSEDLKCLGELMGLDSGEADQVLRVTLERLGHGPQSRERCERLRELATQLMRLGTLSDLSRAALCNRAQEWGIPPRRVEGVIQDVALARARELAGGDDMAAALELLLSATARMIELRPAVRREIEELRGRLRPERESRSAIEGAAKVGSAGPAAVAEALRDPAGAEAPATRQAWTPLGDSAGISWVEIPAGPFTRGCPKWFIKHIEDKFGVDTSLLNTYPMRREDIGPFWISLTPVTHQQFLLFVRSAGHRYPAGWLDQDPPYPEETSQHPVTGVTWQDAVKFAEWLGARLPRRAEYEKACRGEQGLVFPWGNEFDADKCNSAESDHARVLPVGSIPACVSVYGVVDLVGNVWQWAADGTEQKRMSVGGSFASTCEIYGAGFFDLTRPAESSENNLGFRVACDSLVDLAFVSEPVPGRGSDSL